MKFFDRLAELERLHATFAVATVVGRESPVSSHLGDRALIFPDGRMEGFVGGSCSRDIVRRHALIAIHSGKPRLLHIRPQLSTDDERATTAEGERVFVPMGCASEGAVDVYVEPRIPLRRLVIVGFTPVAEALAGMAVALDYDVVRILDESELRDTPGSPGIRLLPLKDLDGYLGTLSPDETARLVAIVASQGHYDEAALASLAIFDVAFLGLLASRKRAASVFGTLRQEGLAEDRLQRVRNPVGLDIGARSPGEVAVSILAEIISKTPARTEVAEMQPSVHEIALDPVCGMEVDVEGARFRFSYGGQAYVFCCAGCRTRFAAAPEQYVHAAQPS